MIPDFEGEQDKRAKELDERQKKQGELESVGPKEEAAEEQLIRNQEKRPTIRNKRQHERRRPPLYTYKAALGSGPARNTRDRGSTVTCTGAEHRRRRFGSCCGSDPRATASAKRPTRRSSSRTMTAPRRRSTSYQTGGL